MVPGMGGGAPAGTRQTDAVRHPGGIGTLISLPRRRLPHLQLGLREPELG